jgi:hypothetical protein
MNVVQVWRDEYRLWCVVVKGEYYGRFPTRDLAMSKAMDALHGEDWEG